MLDMSEKFKTITNLFTTLPPKKKILIIIIIVTTLITWALTGQRHNPSNSLNTFSNNTYENNNYTSQLISLPEYSGNILEEDIFNNTNIIENIITTSKTIKKNDNIASIFKQLNIAQDDLFNIIKDKKNKEAFSQLKPSQKINITYNQDTHSLISLSYYLDKLNLFSIEKKEPKESQNSGASNQNYITKIKRLDLSEKISYAKLTIGSSLFEDAQKQHLPLDLIYQIIDIFTWDIDFAQDLRKNDSVEMLYKEYYLDGALYTTGKILAVNFYNNNKTYGAIRYEDKDTKQAGYYTPDGLSLHKAFIRTPVKFSRISSTFSLGRRHPVLHKLRAHKGVDYAAPTGTPIKAAGDGKIIYYGRKGGYGKTAIIQHGHNYSTLYAHMSNYNSRIKAGSTIKQGEIIGYVGQTGLATGPHLHFEFRINEQHVDPLTVALPRAQPIEKNRADFMRQSKQLLAKLKLQSDLNRTIGGYTTTVAANNKFE